MGMFSGVYEGTGYSSRYSGYSSSGDRTERTTRNTTMKTVEYYLKNGYFDKAIDLLEDNNISPNSSIFRMIENSADDSFTTGLKQSMPILGLFADGTSEFEAVAKLTNTEVPFKEKALEFAGKCLPGVAAIGGGLALGAATATAGVLAGTAIAAAAPIAIPALVIAGTIGIGQNIIRTLVE